MSSTAVILVSMAATDGLRLSSTNSVFAIKWFLYSSTCVLVLQVLHLALSSGYSGRQMLQQNLLLHHLFFQNHQFSPNVRLDMFTSLRFSPGPVYLNILLLAFHSLKQVIIIHVLFLSSAKTAESQNQQEDQTLHVCQERVSALFADCRPDGQCNARSFRVINVSDDQSCEKWLL